MNQFRANILIYFKAQLIPKDSTLEYMEVDFDRTAKIDKANTLHASKEP